MILKFDKICTTVYSTHKSHLVSKRNYFFDFYFGDTTNWSIFNPNNNHMKYASNYLLLFIFLSVFAKAQTIEHPLEKNAESSESIDTVYTLADTVLINELLENSNLLIKQAKIKEALAEVEKAKTIIEQVLGPDNLKMVKAYYTIGSCYYNAGDNPNAILNFKHGIKIIDKIEKGYSEKIKGLNNIANAHNRSSNYKEAIEVLNQAIEVLNKHQPNDKINAFSINLTLGTAYKGLSKFKEAISYSEAALQHAEGDTQRSIKALNNLNTIYFTLEEFDKAIECLEKCISLNQQQGEPNEVTAILYLNLCITSHTIGDYQSAIDYGEKGLNIYLETPSPYQPNIINAYMNIASPYIEKGDFETGLDYLKSALSLATAFLNGTKHQSIYYILNNIGSAYYRVGNDNLALKYYHDSRILIEEIEDSTHYTLATVYKNIGGIHVEKENYDSAFYYLNKGLVISSEKSLAKADLYNSKGIAFFKQKKYLLAETELKKALNIEKRKLGNKNPKVAGAYLLLSKIYQQDLNLDKSKVYLDSAFYALRYEGISSLDQVSSTLFLREVFIQQLDWYIEIFKREKDIKHLNEAYEKGAEIKAILEEQVKLINPYKGNSFMQQYHSIYEKLLSVNHLLYQNKKDESLKRENFNLSEKAKAIMLTIALQQTEALNFTDVPNELILEEKKLRIDLAFQRDRRQKSISQGVEKSDSVAINIANKIFILSQKYDKLTKTLNKDYPEYYKAKFDFSAINLESTQAALNPGQTLLEYFVGDSTLFIFLIKKDFYEVQKIPMDFPLKQWVNEFTKEGIFAYYGKAELNRKLSLLQSVSNYNIAAQNLYNKLIAPVKGKLTKEVIIIPDGELGYLPFEILLTGKPIKIQNFATYPFMIKEHQISYCYSANLLHEMTQKKHQNATQNPLLALAPFVKTPNQAATNTNKIRTLDQVPNNIRYLPESEKEVAAIHKSMKGIAFYGKDASINNLNKSISNSQIIHLSTHASANSEISKNSYLLFSTNTDTIGFEKLYIRDLYNYSINADMVVLSACETGVGKLKKGEGIISLARAFAYAGSKSIFTTLWQVDDKKTKEIIIAFYDHLAAGLPKDAALRKAKLDYLNNKENKGQSLHPFFWAGMVGIGDMGVIKK